MSGGATGDRGRLPAELEETQPLAEVPADGAVHAEPGLPPGATVDRFVIRRQLGRGGMGIVYAAHDPRLERSVALKLVRPKARIDREQGVKRLLREARAAAGINHPNIATVYECGVVDGEIYVAMELVQGATFRAWCEATKPSPDAIVDAAAGAARGLAAAHASGLIHRDVKPENILITAEGVAKVVDFGLVRSAAQESANPGPAPTSGDADLRLTDHRALVGTPGYLSPEYFDRGQVTPALDQFAYCVTLYEMLYGEKPHGPTREASTRDELRAGRTRAAPPGSRVPAQYRKVLLRGLKPDPTERYPSMEALLDALLKARNRKRRRLLATALVATAVASVFAGRLAQGEAGPSCIDESEEAAEKLRGQLAGGLAHLAELHPAAGEPARARVAAITEAWPEGWLSARRAACAADPDASSAERQLTLVCLDTKRREAGVLFDALTTSDIAAARFLATADLRMPSTSDCADASALVTRPPVVADPQEQAAVEEVLARVDQVTAHLALGRVAQADQEAEALAAGVDAINHAPTRAIAWHALGRLDAASDETGGAIEAFKHGIRLAEEARYSGLRLELWLDLGRAYARAGQTEAASVAVDAAKAVGGTMVEPGRFRVEVRLLQARVSLSGDDREGAAELLKETLGWELSVSERERALFALGEVSYGLENASVAARWHREALVLREATYGTDHPLVAESLSALGRVLKTLDPASAVDPLERALAIQESTYGADGIPVAFTLERLAIAYTRLDRADEAVDLLQRAVGILSPNASRSDPNAALVWSRLGSALSALGRHDEALVAHQESYDRLLGGVGESHPRLALPAMNYAFAAKRAARPRLAAAWFDRAIRVLPQRESRLQQIAALRFELAQMLWEAGDDPQRALVEARAALTAFPGNDDEYDGVTRAQIEPWLELHASP